MAGPSNNYNLPNQPNYFVSTDHNLKSYQDRVTFTPWSNKQLLELLNKQDSYTPNITYTPNNFKFFQPENPTTFRTDPFDLYEPTLEKITQSPPSYYASLSDWQKFKALIGFSTRWEGKKYTDCTRNLIYN